MRRIGLTAVMLFFFLTGWAVAAVSDFEDVSLGAEGYYNGSDGAGEFVSGDAAFKNNYDETFESWDGFAASSVTDTTTAGYANQYSAIAGGGAAGSSQYAIGFMGFIGNKPAVEFAEPTAVAGLYVTNATYAYLSMRDGDDFAKRFGGADGSDPDYFKLSITGFDAAGGTTGQVDFYLADFRFDDDSLDYIVGDWTWVDLSRLGAVTRLAFSLESSDVGAFGMNTPAYFALDATAPVEDNDSADSDSDSDDGSDSCFIAAAGAGPAPAVAAGWGGLLAALVAGACLAVRRVKTKR